MSSSHVDATAGAVEHCEQMANDNPDLAVTYQLIASSCQQKLWHQLTLTVMDFVVDPATVRMTSAGIHSYLALYNQVLLSVDSKLNPLSLARIASIIATTISSQDMTAAKAVLENLSEKNNNNDAKADTQSLNANIFVQSKLSLLTLQQHAVPDNNLAPDEKTAQLNHIKTVITQNAAKLAEFTVSPDSVDQAIVHAAHYEQAMTYYKVVGPPEAFYEQAMSFLNYAPPPVQDASTGTAATTTATATVVNSTTNYQQLAVDLCLAALTGDGVYNLGQVEQTPVLKLLRDTPHAWLAELLHTTAAGNVTLFSTLTQTYAAQIQQQPALVHRAAAVQEKLTLLALVHLVFEKDSTERTLTMSEISERLHVSMDQVEWVVMRAFSVHLLEGSMDQVDQTVQITWVLPRTLNDVQSKELAGRFGEWATKVKTTKEFMQEQTPMFA
jgi:26S proteasome regulatory subunit N9